MADPQPSVGRIVHYVSGGTNQAEQSCQAAIVTAVADDGRVRLTAFPPGQGCVPMYGWVAYSAAAVGGTWHWPERVGAWQPV